MNNKTFIALFIFTTATMCVSCGGPAKKETSVTMPAGPSSLHLGQENYFLIDTKQSVVSWKGSNAFGTHTGNVYISKGELRIEDGKILGGMVEVDMNTIEDNDHKSDNNLIKHLKDADFFDVKKFPLAKMTITGGGTINTEQTEIKGDLTIKGITHPVSFPASVKMADGIVKASGNLVIDRTKWDVRYKSGKFFDDLKDQAIADNIEFVMKIVAKK